jgi:hypothetical protein
MSGYGFGKASKSEPKADADALDLSGISREPVATDPRREEAAMQRGAALGFVDRGEGPLRRRRQAAPQGSVYIKGPKDTLDWFVQFTNERGHSAYWQTIAEFREMVEAQSRPGGAGA